MRLFGVSCTALLALAMPPSALAQAGTAGSHVDAIERCLGIADDGRRLECLDRAGRELVAAAGRREIVLVDENQVKTTRRSLFGFTLPRIGLFGRDGLDKAEEIETVEVAIASVSTLGYGKYAIALEGGGRWSTTEAWPGGTEPRRGQIATIRKGALGGYFLKIGSGRAVRAMRVG